MIAATGLQGIGNRGLTTLDLEQRPLETALETARQFEQIFVQEMLAGMRETAKMDGGEGSLFGDGPGSDTYTQWFDNHLSDHLVKNGGLGIADLLMKEFERWDGISASDPEGKESGSGRPSET
ncbi:MAG: rod-binding protein, partial [Acidimicrobiia bacterium]|nr:rod-binding protein [Acidimicrobiia bacterium]